MQDVLEAERELVIYLTIFCSWMTEDGNCCINGLTGRGWYNKHCLELGFIGY